MTNPESLFSQLDKNKDGKLVATEISSKRRRIFEQLLRTADSNKDGALSKQELIAALDASTVVLGPVKKTIDPPPLNPQFAIRRFDRNKDKKLTTDEVPPAARERFNELLKSADKNGDRALNGQELIAAAPLIAQLAKAAKKAKPVARPGPVLDDALFRLIDADRDGKLSDAEIKVAEEVLEEISSKPKSP